MEFSIRDILNQHANALVEWRCIHEDRDSGISFDFLSLIATIELVLDEFGKRFKKMETRPPHVL